MLVTRAALVDAALRLFAEQGLDAPSLDAICERAGYTRGAFYVHFADRDALLVAVMDRVGSRFLERMFAAEPPSSLAEAAERFVGTITSGDYPLMGTGRGQIRFHQLLDACARSPVVGEQYRALIESSIEAIAALALADRRRGALRSDLDPTLVGKAMLATIIGAQTMADLGVEIDAAALARMMLESVARA